MRKFFAMIIPMMLLAGNAHAQAYKYEIGAAVGIGAYVGDANTNPFHKPGAAYGVIFRQNINYRWAIKYDLATTRMRGTTEGLGYAFPDGLKYSFSRQVLDFGAQAEFNFRRHRIYRRSPQRRRVFQSEHSAGSRTEIQNRDALEHRFGVYHAQNVGRQARRKSAERPLPHSQQNIQKYRLVFAYDIHHIV